MRKADILLATLVALVWGGSYVAIKYTVMEIPALLSIAIRYMMVAAILLPFVPKPIGVKFKDIYSASIVMGVFCLGLLYYGTSLGLDNSLTIIVMQLSAPISVIIARLYLKEPLSLGAMLGIIIAFIGMVIVVGSHSFNNNYFALIVVFLAAFALALYYVQSKELESLSPLSLLCWTNLIAAPHLLLLSYFIEGNPLNLIQTASYKLWISLFYSVTIVSLVGMGIWVHLLRKYSIGKVSPFNLLVPFFGIIFSAIFFDETPSWNIMMGAVIIVFGIALSQMGDIPFLGSKEA